MTQAKPKPFVITKRMVWEAYKEVKRKKGAAGVDGQSIEEFERNKANNLYRLWNRLASGSYFPPAVLQVKIPKHDGGERALGIPTVIDRIAQTVVKQALEPEVEPYFHPDSYGYRPGRSAHQALEQARKRCWQYRWALDLDIRSFFDSLDHNLAMRAIRHFTNCRWILLYIERWLKADVQVPDGTLEKREQGTPQGGVASPLIANIFLHLAFDQWMREEHSEVPFERYADDVIVHCRTREQAEGMKRRIEERLRRCRLQLHPLKTRVVCCDPRMKRQPKHFDFLGYRFRPRLAKSRAGVIFTTFSPAISPSAAKRIRQTIRRIWRLPRRTQMDLNELAELMNPAIVGWTQYYGKYRPSALVSVFRWINMALRLWAMRKYKRFKGRPNKAMSWLRDIAIRDRGLLEHWRTAGLIPTVAGR